MNYINNLRWAITVSYGDGYYEPQEIYIRGLFENLDDAQKALPLFKKSYPGSEVEITTKEAAEIGIALSFN